MGKVFLSNLASGMRIIGAKILMVHGCAYALFVTIPTVKCMNFGYFFFMKLNIIYMEMASLQSLKYCEIFFLVVVWFYVSRDRIIDLNHSKFVVHFLTNKTTNCRFTQHCLHQLPNCILSHRLRHTLPHQYINISLCQVFISSN